ncbi:MAG: glycosyltransferase [Thermodesulfobacteriota bacterium]
MTMAIQPSLLGRKKKILILISRGGGGHKTAGESLKQILGPDYDVEINSVMADILAGIDPLNCVTRGNFTGEDLYNLLLQGHWNKLLKWMVTYGPRFWKTPQIEKRFEKYFRSQVQIPDLIISVTPYINYGIARAAHRWDVPLLIIPTDLDGSTFLAGFPERPTHHHFKFALPYNDPEIKQTTLQKTVLLDDQLTITGFPVRPACQKKYTAEELKTIRSKFNLFESHQTATLIMGAVGGNLIFDHVKILSKLDPRDHQLELQLNICVGHNNKMGDKIRNYLFDQGAKFLGRHTFLLPTGLVMHIRGFTKEIIELMAASDLIITKTGSCTVNEAIYLGKKLLLDNTRLSSAQYLWWEKFNIPFVEKHRLGHAFTNNHQLLMLIPSLLKYPDKLAQDLELPNFEENILNVVQQMI